MRVDIDGRRAGSHALRRAARRRFATSSGPTIVVRAGGRGEHRRLRPLEEIVALCREAGAWLHVDGAFGLWAGASPALRTSRPESSSADSWATDAHKWLNVPYDSGLAFVAHPEAHRAAMRLTAEYLVADPDAARDQMDWTPEFSRRARGFAVYAALRSLGRSGVADLVDGSLCPRAAVRGSDRPAPRVQGVNEVVLNQVLFRFADDETTNAVLARRAASGEAWMSGTVWDGRAAIRLSVSNWRTSETRHRPHGRRLRAALVATCS